MKLIAIRLQNYADLRMYHGQRIINGLIVKFHHLKKKINGLQKKLNKYMKKVRTKVIGAFEMTWRGIMVLM